MATITVTMIIFVVFIASIHGDSTFKIAPCNCSFSNNIEILSKYIEERINATVASRVAELLVTASMQQQKIDSKPGDSR